MTTTDPGGQPIRPPARLGVLLSGRGSNFLAIHAAIESGELPAEIALVVSDQPDARGLTKARQLGLAARAVPRTAFATRAAHQREIVDRLQEAAVDWVCLAGFMRILVPSFVRAFPGRIVNIHPSLLPSFPGLNAQQQAIEHGVKVSGCTVHLVDEGLDSGPILVQRTVPVLDDDTEDSLAERILEQEHDAYPDALRRLFEARWSVLGRKVLFS